MESNLMMKTIINLLSELKKIEENRVNLILHAKDAFSRKLQEEKNKLPYNINLLDELRVNENAHSRILVKLLQYKDQGKYIILETFLKELDDPFDKLVIVNPEISQEKFRIDVLINDKHFAIIIENKVNGAQDLTEQIERYIEKVNHKEKAIYIIYLTREGGSPDENSFPKERRLAFGKRYKEINYKHHILPIIKDKILSLIQFKNDLILKSAVIQYKDHLEGLFYEREGEEKMKNEMIKIVRETLQLKNENEGECLRKIIDFENYTQELLEYLNETKKDTFLSTFRKISEILCGKKIKGIETITFSSPNFGLERTEIRFKPTGWNENYSICLCFQNGLTDLFYGIKSSNGNPELNSNPLISELKKTLGENNDPNDMWPYASYYILEDEASDDALINLIENNTLINLIETKVTEIINKTENVKRLHDMG